MRPDHREFLGSYVRAIHDFPTDIPGEVNLVKGDVFQVTEVIDNNWLHGKSRDKEGNFPYDFVEKIQLPVVEVGQKVFGAIEKFTAAQDGDLDLQKGDVIVGLYQVDEFWWQGTCKGQEGIFPVTHVMEMEIPKLIRMRSKSVHSSEPLFAQALVDSKAQLDEELSFQVGDLITVTQVIDEDWYMGECHGKTGMFLAACVQLINEEECNEKAFVQTSPIKSNIAKDITNNYSNNRTSYSDNQTSYNNNRTSYSDNLTSFSDKQNSYCDNKDKYNNSSGEKGKISGDNTIVNAPSVVYDTDVNVTPAYTSENTKSHNDFDGGVTPYARTLYPFVGELGDELSFSANDIVTLIQHVDEQWIEGEIDGKIGVFPANYVEIVVDCPYAYEQADTSQTQLVANEDCTGTGETPVSVQSTLATKQQDSMSAQDLSVSEDSDHYGLVLYSFSAETRQDLSVQEGETVTIIQKIDENWLLVQNDVGHTGMCPASFVEMIGAIPDFTHKTHDKNKNHVQTASTGGTNTNTHNATHITNTAEYSPKLNHDNKQHDMTSPQEIKPTHGSSEPICEIKTHSHVPSNHKTSLTGQTSKPRLKPKPALAPKPALKPKPLLSPKPFTQPSGYKSVSIDCDIPKASSSVTLSSIETTKDSTGSKQTGMNKSQSMVEISQSDHGLSTSLGESKGSDSGSCSSVTGEADQRTTIDTKTFDNWDMSKPLDSLLEDEFNKAKVAADTKMTKQLERSAGSVDSPRLAGYHGDPARSSPHTRPKSFTPNYSRENFEFDEFVKVGNSSFLMQTTEDTPHRPHVRKPPRPPSKLMNDFEQRPSLKKPAPPRPKGPRIPPAPSKTPIVPVRTVASHSTHVALSTDGPASRPMRRKHSRPAPPRPQPAKKQPTQKQRAEPTQKQRADDLISFSPTNGTQDVDADVIAVDEPDSDTVLELKARITDMEKDLQNFQKSKVELEQMQSTLGSDDTGEIHDNIQFYDDNIHGITQELNSLKETLAKVSPRESNKLAQEKAAELRKLEEQKSREEMKKKLEEEKKERKKKRIKVIEELIQTERDFICSMTLIVEVFLSSSTEKHPGVNNEVLFGNIEEVVEVSQKLLTILEEATQGKDFDEQIIGSCFVVMSEDMKNVYAPYCRNHDNVICLIEKYEQNADTKAYLDGLLDVLREKHVVFDLEALLIKPVQRVLKYPLLLNALIKATEDDHPDKETTLSAISTMTDVATAINEYKRRKDLVYKYKKDSDASLGDMLAKLSLHSLKKKSSRIRERFSANLGFIDQTRDANFDKEENQFRQLEKTVKIFVKNVQLFMEQIQDVVSCEECLSADVEDFYGEKRDLDAVQKYQTFHNNIRMTLLPNLQLEVDELVTLPLNQVIQMFDAPSKVIQKRYDKLLDYDNMKRKAQSDRVSEKAVEAARVNYEAMNAQLLEELPKFSQLTFKLFRDCVGSFVRAQREFAEKLTHDMYSVLDVSIMHDEGVIETFNIQHSSIVDKLALLTFMPKSFSPRVADQKQDKKNKRLSLDPSMLRSSEALPQIDSQRIYVTQQYPTSKLYRVTKTHVAQDGMDLSVCEGDVVGIIMEKDPMGNRERWFSDSGAAKGFISRQLLVAYEASPPRPTSQLLQPSVLTDSGGKTSPQPSSPHSPISLGSFYIPASNSAVSDSASLHTVPESTGDMDFALDEDMTPDVPDNAHALQGGNEGALQGGNEEEEIELYYAEYAFAARNNNEVSLFEHQVVTVIAQHDQEGNKEWWYVDADGVHGYAPALYLKKMDTH